jgi:DNA-binding PadR family transcriptional regulator
MKSKGVHQLSDASWALLAALEEAGAQGASRPAVRRRVHAWLTKANYTLLRPSSSTFVYAFRALVESGWIQSQGERDESRLAGTGQTVPQPTAVYTLTEEGRAALLQHCRLTYAMLRCDTEGEDAHHCR